MKTLISLFALFLSLTLTAQTNPATWYLNDASGNGIQSPSNIASGALSTAMGGSTTASGNTSTAMGRGTIASGDDSTAMGANSEASGEYSTATGDRTKAIGDRSTAMGENTVASGHHSTAMGVQTEASGGTATTMGYLTLASGSDSFASGYNTAATGAISRAMGQYSLASGELSTALGKYTRASDFGSVVIGQSNLAGANLTASATEFSLNNTAFVIGNGTDENSRSDALTVLFDGTTTIAGDLNVNSDARLKANIISLGSTLSKLLQIDGKSYTMKKDESEKQKIGLLAQDIEKVFPELISESHGIKSVNYQGLVPVLINALKEQDAMMKEQDNRLSKQQSEIDELKAMLKKLIEKA